MVSSLALISVTLNSLARYVEKVQYMPYRSMENMRKVKAVKCYHLLMLSASLFDHIYVKNISSKYYHYVNVISFSLA
jgi:hypothetical protein